MSSEPFFARWTDEKGKNVKWLPSLSRSVPWASLVIPFESANNL
jgi:hypothetical protein